MAGKKPVITIGRSMELYLEQTENNRQLQAKYSKQFRAKEWEKTKASFRKALLRPTGLYTPEEPVQGSEEGIRISLIDDFCSRTKKSELTYALYAGYVKYIHDMIPPKKGEKSVEAFPRMLTPLERQLSIARDIQEYAPLGQAAAYRKLIEELPRRYLVTEKTIRNDLLALQDGIGVMDQKFQIDYHSKAAQISSAHPMFLVPNLTQAALMLQGLYRTSTDPLCRDYSFNMAVSIWRQLSPYASNRILTRVVGWMHLDRAWFEQVAEAAKNRKVLFQNELESAQGGNLEGIPLYLLKNGGYSPDITWEKPDGTLASTGRVRILRYTDQDILVNADHSPEYSIPIAAIRDIALETRQR